MDLRSASLVVALLAGTVQPSAAMPVERVTPGSLIRRVSLPEAADRTLIIRRSVDTWAVRAIQGEGWAVPIIGSVRILAARFEPW